MRGFFFHFPKGAAMRFSTKQMRLDTHYCRKLLEKCLCIVMGPLRKLYLCYKMYLQAALNSDGPKYLNAEWL